MRRTTQSLAVAMLAMAWTAPARADPFFFSTGNPDGKIATLSRQASPGLLETETADDFILNTATSLTNAHFTGLLPSGSSQSDVSNVEIKFYHVFPKDSADPPSGNVPTRVNSPADVEIACLPGWCRRQPHFFQPRSWIRTSWLITAW